jgi:hypothetical protein
MKATGVWMRDRLHSDRPSCVLWQLLLSDMNTADGVPGDVLLLVLSPFRVLCTTKFCADIAFMCSVWIREERAVISLYSINWLVFITETECLLRGTDWIFIILRSAHTVYLCVLCGSENKQRLFRYTALTDCVCNRDGVCLLRGTSWIFVYNSV